MILSITTSQYAAEFPTDQYSNIREFISKPVEPEILLGKIKQHIWSILDTQREPRVWRAQVRLAIISFGW